MSRPNTGSVAQLPSGKFSVRLTLADGKRKRLGPFNTEAEALVARDEFKTALVDPPPPGDSFRSQGESFIAKRDRSGELRSVKNEWAKWRTHLLVARFVDAPVASITQADVEAWVAEMKRKNGASPHGRGPRKPLTWKTRHDVLLLLKQILKSAGNHAADDVHMKRERRTHEPWTYLNADEQRALLTCEAIPAEDRLVMMFAIGTGIRQGEQFSLRLEDLHVDGERPHIVVRYGSKLYAPKNGKIRHVPLFGIGLKAAKLWLEALPTFAPKNPLGLVFPGRGGGHRGKGKHLHRNGREKVNLFAEYLRMAGIMRPVRWHDLRHTCASSLVAGWWGRAWSLFEVSKLLGHHSVTMTEIYAHLSKNVLASAAEATPGLL
jgi:integrase